MNGRWHSTLKGEDDSLCLPAKEAICFVLRQLLNAWHAAAWNFLTIVQPMNHLKAKWKRSIRSLDAAQVLLTGTSPGNNQLAYVIEACLKGHQAISWYRYGDELSSQVIK